MACDRERENNHGEEAEGKSGRDRNLPPPPPNHKPCAKSTTQSFWHLPETPNPEQIDGTSWKVIGEEEGQEDKRQAENNHEEEEDEERVRGTATCRSNPKPMPQTQYPVSKPPNPEQTDGTSGRAKGEDDDT